METDIIGKIENIEIRTTLDNEKKINVKYLDFSSEVKNKFQEYKQKKNDHKDDLDRFINPLPEYFSITNEEYNEILTLKESILYHRSITNQVYIQYLLQSLNVKNLKELCKEYEIRGYSQKKKQEVIQYLCDNLSEEEIFTFLREREFGLISLESARALQIINKKSIEKITNIRIINLEKHEIEVHFEGPKWAGDSSLTINKFNIDDPERDCQCISGSEEGFCQHFWIGFIYSLKKGFLNLSDWKLTTLPTDFKKTIKDIKFEEWEVKKS